MSSGIGFGITIKIGMFLNEIPKNIQKLHRQIDEALLMHNLYETFSPKDNRILISKNRKKITQIANETIVHINILVRKNNSIMTLLKVEKKLIPIPRQKALNIVKKRFSSQHSGDKVQEIANENLKHQLNNTIAPLERSIRDLVNYVEKENTRKGIKNLVKKYQDGIDEALDIASIGYFNTSTFVVGRTIETLLDDHLKMLIGKKQIKKIDLRHTKYADKISILKAQKVINDRQFHDLNSLRIDRNDNGHPFRKKTSKEWNTSVIDKSILIIRELQKKN